MTSVQDPFFARDPDWVRKLKIDVSELRAEVAELQLKNNKLRRQRDKARMQRDQMSVHSQQRRVVRLKLMAPSSDGMMPIATQNIALSPGVTESVKLYAHVRPEDPALSGYFITADVYMEVVE